MSLSKEELMEKYEHAKKMVKLERKILGEYKEKEKQLEEDMDNIKNPVTKRVIEGVLERIEWNKEYTQDSIEVWEAKVKRYKESLRQLGVGVNGHD